MAETIGEMSDADARMVMLRASVEALGVVPESAQRNADGGYELWLNLDPESMNQALRCGADVGIDYDVRGVCGRPLGHDYHRPDAQCSDRDAHAEDAPYTLHHPFMVAQEGGE